MADEFSRLIGDVEQFLGGGAAALEDLGGVQTLPGISPDLPVDQEQTERSTGTVEEATASPSVRRPSIAVRVARFPVAIFRSISDQFMSGNAVMDSDFLVGAIGEIVVEGFITSDSTATTLAMTLSGSEAPDAQWGLLNGGANLVEGAWFRESHAVMRGDAVNFKFGGNVTAMLRVTFREGD